MIIKKLVIGAFQVNNYLIICPDTHEAALIDAGGDYNVTIKEINKNNAKIKYILNTHGHLDHIAGDCELQEKTNARVLIHKNDEFLVEALKEQLTMFGMPDYNTPQINEFIEDNQIIKLGNLNIKVIHTPGHSAGSVCFLIDKILFSGDTLFQNSVGRTDLPGGSYEELEKSVKNKLFSLDEDILVYPGHGPETTIKNEKENNPFFGQRQI